MNVPGRFGKRGDFLRRGQPYHIHVIALEPVPRDEAGFASPENVLDDLLCLDLVRHAQEDGDSLGLLILTVGHHLLPGLHGFSTAQTPVSQNARTGFS